MQVLHTCKAQNGGVVKSVRGNQVNKQGGVGGISQVSWKVALNLNLPYCWGLCGKGRATTSHSMYLVRFDNR